jgi:hypothetical protein
MQFSLGPVPKEVVTELMTLVRNSNMYADLSFGDWSEISEN